MVRPIVVSSHKQAQTYLGTAHLQIKVKKNVDHLKRKVLQLRPHCRAFARIKLDHVIPHFDKQKQLIPWSGLCYEPVQQHQSFEIIPDTLGETFTQTQITSGLLPHRLLLGHA